LTTNSGGLPIAFNLRRIEGKPGDGFVYDGWNEAFDCWSSTSAEPRAVVGV
jgi:hypothetical protein